MRVNDLRLNYSAGPGFEPRSVHVQSPDTNVHRVTVQSLRQSTVHT